MKNRAAIAVIALVQAAIGFEWVKAGWEKVSDPNFVAHMSQTIGVFAGKNPTSWYKDFLTGVVSPNAAAFGWLVAYGEFIAGVVLLTAAVSYLFYGAGTDIVSRLLVPIGAVGALVGGAFLSANFWFAAGWMSVSTDSLNALMFLTQVVLAGSTIYFMTQTSPQEEEEATEVAWDRLFKPTPTEKPLPKEPAGIAR